MAINTHGIDLQVLSLFDFEIFQFNLRGQSTVYAY